MGVVSIIMPTHLNSNMHSAYILVNGHGSGASGVSIVAEGLMYSINTAYPFIQNLTYHQRSYDNNYQILKKNSKSQQMVISN